MYYTCNKCMSFATETISKLEGGPQLVGATSEIPVVENREQAQR